MLIFDLPDKRELMHMEAIFGKLLEAPPPPFNGSGIAQRLNMDHAVIRHHLHLPQDEGRVAEMENGYWRLTNAGARDTGREVDVPANPADPEAAALKPPKRSQQPGQPKQARSNTPKK